MSEKFEFLSPEWEKAADEIVGNREVDNPTEVQLTINITVTPTPYGDKQVSIVGHYGYSYERYDARQSCSSRQYGQIDVNGFKSWCEWGYAFS